MSRVVLGRFIESGREEELTTGEKKKSRDNE